MSMIIIIAGNQNQAFAWAGGHNLKPKEYRLATTVDRVRGMRGCKYVLTGTCYERPDFEEIMREIEAQGLEELDML